VRCGRFPANRAHERHDARSDGILLEKQSGGTHEHTFPSDALAGGSSFLEGPQGLFFVLEKEELARSHLEHFHERTLKSAALEATPDDRRRFFPSEGIISTHFDSIFS